jgi:hypothetical protein
MRHGTWSCGARLVRAALATSLLAAALAGPALAAESSSTQGRVTRPVIEKADGTACVADPAFMRKNHMDLLKHQRDDTMHLGIRTPKFSLTGCISCHASKKTNSVNADAGDFCQSCHHYAGVTLDCFECHSAMPRAASTTARAASAAAPAASISVQSASAPASSANAANGGKQ